MFRLSDCHSGILGYGNMAPSVSFRYQILVKALYSGFRFLRFAQGGNENASGLLSVFCWRSKLLPQAHSYTKIYPWFLMYLW
jgi:hypothetical protein